MEKPLNKIQLNGQNQGTPILVETIEINRFSPNGETRLTENQGVTKSSQDDKWTSSKIGVSPSETDSPNSGGNCKIAFADFFKAFTKIGKPY